METAEAGDGLTATPIPPDHSSKHRYRNRKIARRKWKHRHARAARLAAKASRRRSKKTTASAGSATTQRVAANARRRIKGATASAGNSVKVPATARGLPKPRDLNRPPVGHRKWKKQIGRRSAMHGATETCHINAYTWNCENLWPAKTGPHRDTSRLKQICLEMEAKKCEFLALTSTGDARSDGAPLLFQWTGLKGRRQKAMIVCVGADNTKNHLREGCAVILRGKALDLFNRAKRNGKENYGKISGRILFVDLNHPGVGLVRIFVPYVPTAVKKHEKEREDVYALLHGALNDAKKDKQIKATRVMGDLNSRIDLTTVAEHDRGKHARDDKVHEMKDSDMVKIGSAQLTHLLASHKLRTTHGFYEPSDTAPPGTWYHRRSKKWYTPDHSLRSRKLWNMTTDAGTLAPNEWNVGGVKDTPDHTVLWERWRTDMTTKEFWAMRRNSQQHQTKSKKTWVPIAKDWTPKDMKTYSQHLTAQLAAARTALAVDSTIKVPWSELVPCMLNACKLTFPNKPEKIQQNDISPWQVEQHRRKAAGQRTTSAEKKKWNSLRRAHRRCERRRRATITVKRLKARIAGMQVKTDVSQFLTTDEQSDHLEKLYGKETLTHYKTLPIVAGCFEDIRP